ncbi:sensor histidine kinase [Rhodobacteraceae bacterium 2376]|uniref:histidine kinase n=1 Tax=Rhabdonatronobacter sediminivivens TaxID=2743469 RepID=A0A7Z0I1L0_9RHOB|nr:sensor histidine kinase [Rhabdonatronobacter sediminivivens]NYS25922.1 sensor histidine kinase [Rhabdonatronobacter sediminivivens]
MSVARTDVVLGEDWVRPDDAVESEVQQRRARRGVFSIYRSPLARKIVLFNLVALILLVAGILFTNPFRDNLLLQHERTLITKAEMVADVISGAGGMDAAGPALVSALTLDPETELILFTPEAEVAERKSGARRFSSPPPEDGYAERSTVISNFLSSVWSGLTLVTGSHLLNEDAPDLETARAEVLQRAAAGMSDSHVLRNASGGGMWIIVAAPVLQDGALAGTVMLQTDASAIDQSMRHEREQVLQMFLIALLVSIGLSFALASTIANPLADLAMAAELGRNRDARKVNPGRVRIPDLTGRPDEIGRLSKAMRGMVSALYDRIEVNEQFAADVSHEIKNPLASLRSAVGTLRMAKREDQVQRLLDVVEHDVRRIDRLISDTSNASRLDSELVKEEEEEFDLCRTLGNLSEHLSREAASKGVEFIRALPEEPIIITGLEARLAQVFVNLITNAISFCEPGDAVRIWARKRDDRVLVVVEDTGPGIPEQALTRIFKRFYSERPEKQFGNHSGLGLAISKQIVEAHNGVIWAENIRAPGESLETPPLGARFVVGLPM